MAKIIEGAALIAGAVALAFVPGFQFGSGILFSLAFAAASTGVSVLFAGIAEAMRHDLGSTVAVRQAAAAQTIVYGRSRIGGVMVYISLTDSNKYLHMVIVHCSHSVQSIAALYLDGKQVMIGGDGITDDGNDHYDASGTKYNFKGHVRWEKRLGSPTQLSFSSLSAADANWPSTATLSGHTASYVRLEYDSSVFPSGIPGIRVDIVGKNDIYDPRTGTRGYTENWALCVADVLCDVNYGLQCNYATEIDEAQLIAAANVCDESVLLKSGASESRYTVNGFFDTSSAPGDILQNMMTAAAGRMTYVGGLWKVYPAYWQGPGTLSLSQLDLLGPMKWTPKRKYRDLVNGVKATFVCPSFPYTSSGPGLALNQPIAGVFDGQWRQTDAPPYMQDALHGYAADANLSADGNTRLWLDLRFPFTISVAACQRLMKIYLLRNRQQGTGTVQCNLVAYQLKVLNVVPFSYARWGWTNKLLEVSNFRLNFEMEDGKPNSISVSLDLQETDASVYAWSASEELAIQQNTPPRLPNMSNVAGPGNLVLHSGDDTATLSADGIKRARLLVTWDSPDDSFVIYGGYIELQYEPSGASAWLPLMQFDGAARSAYIEGVSDGVAYYVRIRSLTVSGAYSDWVTAGPYTISATMSTYSSTAVAVNGNMVS